VSKVVSIAELRPYLNNFAQKYFKDSYFQENQTFIGRYLYRKSVQTEIPNNIFILGKIDGKYPFSMAINFAKDSKQVSGFYYYNDSQTFEKIMLNGEYNDKGFNMQETVDNKVTGHFSFTWSNEYSPKGYLVSYMDNISQYLSGSWAKPDHSKIFDVEISSVKNNKP